MSKDPLTLPVRIVPMNRLPLIPRAAMGVQGSRYEPSLLEALIREERIV